MKLRCYPFLTHAERNKLKWNSHQKIYSDKELKKKVATQSLNLTFQFPYHISIINFDNIFECKIFSVNSKFNCKT